MNIKGLYEKKGWFYYQPPTSSSGSRPNAVALRTQDPQEAAVRCFEAMERVQLMAAAVDGRMDQAIDQYLQAKKAAREHGPKTSYTTGQTLMQISREMGNPKLSDLTEKKIENWANNLRARKCQVAIRGSKKKNTEASIKERKKSKVSDSSVASHYKGTDNI